MKKKCNTGTKSLRLYPLGTQNVAIPPGGNMADVYNKSINEAMFFGNEYGQYGALPGALGGAFGALGGLNRGMAQKRIEDAQMREGRQMQSQIYGQEARFGGMQQQQVEDSDSRTIYASAGNPEMGTRMYKTGSKKPDMGMVEVEKDELIFRPMKMRNGGSTYKLVADFKGGDTHEEGGEPFVAKEGDVIFPGKDRQKILPLVNEFGLVEDDSIDAFEQYRSKLPETGGNKKALGDPYLFAKRPEAPINTAYTVPTEQEMAASVDAMIMPGGTLPTATSMRPESANNVVPKITPMESKKLPTPGITPADLPEQKIYATPETMAGKNKKAGILQAGKEALLGMKDRAYNALEGFFDVHRRGVAAADLRNNIENSLLYRNEYYRQGTQSYQDGTKKVKKTGTETDSISTSKGKLGVTVSGRRWGSKPKHKGVSPEQAQKDAAIIDENIGKGGYNKRAQVFIVDKKGVKRTLVNGKGEITTSLAAEYGLSNEDIDKLTRQKIRERIFKETPTVDASGVKQGKYAYNNVDISGSNYWIDVLLSPGDLLDTKKGNAPTIQPQQPIPSIQEQRRQPQIPITPLNPMSVGGNYSPNIDLPNMPIEPKYEPTITPMESMKLPVGISPAELPPINLPNPNQAAEDNAAAKEWLDTRKKADKEKAKKEGKVKDVSLRLQDRSLFYPYSYASPDVEAYNPLKLTPYNYQYQSDPTNKKIDQAQRMATSGITGQLGLQNAAVAGAGAIDQYNQVQQQEAAKLNQIQNMNVDLINKAAEYNAGLLQKTNENNLANKAKAEDINRYGSELDYNRNLMRIERDYRNSIMNAQLGLQNKDLNLRQEYLKTYGVNTPRVYKKGSKGIKNC